MGEGNNSLSLSSLVCQDDESFFDELKEEEDENPDMNYYNNPCFVSENEDEYIKTLFERETGFGSRTDAVPSGDCSITSFSSWLKCARFDAIQWILNTRAIFRFQCHTAYLSITYFDRFLSKLPIDKRKSLDIQLLSVACLSLAAKMEEYEVPALSEFPTEGTDFDDKAIQKMELFVLKTLEWKMGLITPFPYLHYFTSKFSGESRPKELVSRAVGFILAIAKEINLMDHRPSTIAAAAVLAASDGHLSRKAMELKMEVISLWGSQENEHLFSCYKLMLEIEVKKNVTPELVMSPDLSEKHSGSTDILENQSFISGAGAKRRLTCNDSDQNCPLKKIGRW